MEGLSKIPLLFARLYSFERGAPGRLGRLGMLGILGILQGRRLFSIHSIHSIILILFSPPRHAYTLQTNGGFERGASAPGRTSASECCGGCSPGLATRLDRVAESHVFVAPASLGGLDRRTGRFSPLLPAYTLTK